MSDDMTGSASNAPLDDATHPEIDSESASSTSSEQASTKTELIGEELVLEYRTSEEPVIDEASLSVESGSVTALIGPNGSGKSTLLKGLSNQLAPQAGTVLLDGRDIHSLDTKELARTLGHLSQESTSPGSLTVEDLVYHGRYPHRGFFESVTGEDRKAVEHAIHLAGIDHLRERGMGSLSGGQKQLAWIAMVLAQKTDVLLLDEPTTFLDLRHQLQVMEIIETLGDESEITVVLVLHDIEQAGRYADYMIALQDGTIQARGTPEAVITEQLLAEVFDIEATVENTPRGPRIDPLRPLHDERGDPPTKR